MSKRIFVFGDWDDLEKATLIGQLTADTVRGKEVFSFQYDQDWLKKPASTYLDPDLQLFAGPQYVRDEKPNFGMFLDSSPDRWGRVLMKRREAIFARREKRSPTVFGESDFLLGVYDANRIGGLRFKTDPEGPFLASDPSLAAPPWVSLRELEHAVLELEKDDKLSDNQELKWLDMLMAPGSSLGGTRPKASITDQQGNLWIAKFPSGNDDVNTGGWEMLVHQLAKECGIKVSEARHQKFSSRHHTFITRRFDRTGENRRIHFASAMTLLGHSDGADHYDGASYLDLVGFIQQYGNNPKENLKELWKRVLFNILVKNTDDHLRNHGFLLTKDGWELSPAYDMNPVPTGTGLTLNISENDNSLDPELALSVARHFRLINKDAANLLVQMKKIVSQWRKLALDIGIANQEQERMAGAFYVES
ncbi:type II toxin-antitoxin system HipA family toxin [Hufsiella ginkgonis]|uniref:Type II toxin-antitoxin system HipA family toxin n=1 Tax=Hufsiella ginkgonis TaxID=2695274 RepID=A0A7K1XTE4_9SPHI|nr:HipA domain-containing protein [Hufsiella ginkgonis]MXV13786.1 type II toxin-antitoxin system HipA family toxin [Hufsiella ginkgonis]